MKKYDDSMLVEAYKETKRCHLVAERFGCSDETVRRALIKYNVSRTKNKSHPRKETKDKIDLEERIAIVNDYYTTIDSNNDDIYASLYFAGYGDDEKASNMAAFREKYNIKECNDLYETDYGRDIYN